MIQTGRCNEAIELESLGVINCNADDCPEDCAICQVCKSQIPCPETVAPVASPQPTPVLVPTLAPTIPFELSVCASYSRDW